MLGLGVSACGITAGFNMYKLKPEYKKELNP